MAVLNKKVILRKSKKVQNFRRVEIFNYKKNIFKFYIDKNDGVHDVTRCEVLSWKIIDGGKKVPDEVKETREVILFNRIKGNPTAIAVQKTMTYIEAAEL